MGRLKNLAKNSPTAARMSVAKGYGEVASLGVSFILSLLIGTAIGWWLDNKFGWKPYGFLGGLALGLAAAVRSAYVVLKPLVRRPAPTTSKSDPPQPYDDRP
jgi:F0F1-type ATP synthase assembly protein I